MSDATFVAEMSKLERPTRRLVLAPGDPGPRPITKIGGEPWWPGGVDRPQCPKAGHAMAFMVQVQLRDMPQREGQRLNGLLSFHYCEECTADGDMSFGWADDDSCEDAGGYEVRVFHDPRDADADGAGIVAESPLEPHTVAFADVVEVPSSEDLPTTLDVPDEWLADLEDDFDERVYPGLRHVTRSKLGGWPSWAQGATWPRSADGSRMTFVGQLDWDLGQNSSWGGGGYAYLFANLKGSQDAHGELVILTT